MSRERGRKKLMLRIPEIRHFLASSASETLSDLFESYDLAADSLERFRTASPTDELRVLEYEGLCREIEAEVVVYCDERYGKQMRS